MDYKRLLRSAMIDKGITYKELGEKVGWTGQNFNYVINHNRRLGFITVDKACKGLGLTLRVEANGKKISDPNTIAHEMAEALQNDKRIGYDAVVGIANSLGYDINIYDEDGRKLN